MGLELSAVAYGAFADEQAFSELASHPELLCGLIAQLKDGLAVLDLRGKCVLVNRALCDMTGFSAAELLVTPPCPYWPATDAAEIAGALTQAESTEVWLQRKSGERFAAVLRPTRISDTHGKTLALVTSVTDLTVTRQAEVALKALGAALAFNRGEPVRVRYHHRARLQISLHQPRDDWLARRGLRKGAVAARLPRP